VKTWWAVAVGGAIVATLLLVPLRLDDGEGTMHQCGTMFSTDVSQWQNNGDGNYRDRAYRACSQERHDRLMSIAFVGLATAAVAVTVLVTKRKESPRRTGSGYADTLPAQPDTH